MDAGEPQEGGGPGAGAQPVATDAGVTRAVDLPVPTQDQANYLRGIRESSEVKYDPTVIVGGPRLPKR